jgi:hypothetical protein
MSAVNRATKGARRTRTTSKPRARLGVVSVSWVVSRDAAAPAWGVAAGEGEVELRWLLDIDAGASRCVMVDGTREIVIAEGSSSGSSDNGLVHVQASASADEFSATLRDGTVLYARTTVLSRAGVGGGRYEVVR